VLGPRGGGGCHVQGRWGAVGQIFQGRDVGQGGQEKGPAGPRAEEGYNLHYLPVQACKGHTGRAEDAAIYFHSGRGRTALPPPLRGAMQGGSAPPALQLGWLNARKCVHRWIGVLL
jgi:hypothetical protein